MVGVLWEFIRPSRPQRFKMGLDSGFESISYFPRLKDVYRAANEAI
ncbi:MAG: hypothetical protein WAM91_07905 [Candidatus Acidiferrales bacterium]